MTATAQLKVVPNGNVQIEAGQLSSGTPIFLLATAKPAMQNK